MLIPKENVSSSARGDAGCLLPEGPEQGSLRPLGGVSFPFSATYERVLSLSATQRQNCSQTLEITLSQTFEGNLRRKSETLTSAISRGLRAVTRSAHDALVTGAQGQSSGGQPDGPGVGFLCP